MCSRDRFVDPASTSYTWNCLRFLPKSTVSVAAADFRFATGATTTVVTYVNTAGTAANAVYKPYTVTQPTPVTKSAIGLLSSVAVAIGALAMLQ